jgi:hypothetical protein
MKPNLINKKIIYNMLNEKKTIINELNYKKTNLLFNFFVILFLIIFFLILIFRYFDKKENEKNIS